MDLKNLNFAERWTKNFFSRENVSELEEEEKEEDILEILEVKEQFDEEEEEIEEKKEESEQIRIQKVTKSGNQSQSKKKEVKFESLTLIIQIANPPKVVCRGRLPEKNTKSRMRSKSKKIKTANSQNPNKTNKRKAETIMEHQLTKQFKPYNLRSSTTSEKKVLKIDLRR